MYMQVFTVRRQKGVGAKSNKPYDFQVIGGLIPTENGTDFAEVVLDGDAPTPESGKRYDMEIAFYPDREKKMQHKVVALRPAVAKA